MTRPPPASAMCLTGPQAPEHGARQGPRHWRNSCTAVPVTKSRELQVSSNWPGKPDGEDAPSAPQNAKLGSAQVGSAMARGMHTIHARVPAQAFQSIEYVFLVARGRSDSQRQNIQCLRLCNRTGQYSGRDVYQTVDRASGCTVGHGATTVNIRAWGNNLILPTRATELGRTMSWQMIFFPVLPLSTLTLVYAP